MTPDLAAIHQQLDSPPTAEVITKAICEELFTVQDVVRYCVSCFSAHHIFVGHGTDNYWDEALEIVQACMHLQPPCDESTLASRLTSFERALIARIVVKRIFERLPVPYSGVYIDRRADMMISSTLSAPRSTAPLTARTLSARV